MTILESKAVIWNYNQSTKEWEGFGVHLPVKVEYGFQFTWPKRFIISESSHCKIIGEDEIRLKDIKPVMPFILVPKNDTAYIRGILMVEMGTELLEQSRNLG